MKTYQLVVAVAVLGACGRVASLGNGGEKMPLEPCMERSNCSWFKPVPPP